MNRRFEEITHPKYRISPASSGDIARVAFFGNSGQQAVNYLLDKSHNDEEHSSPFVWAGRHMGMPLQHAWAITVDGSPIESHLEAVMADAQLAADTLPN